MNERGIALPTALIALAILLSLMVAFAVLSRSEPVIAENHAKGSIARAFAESGVERAIWALSNPAATGGIPTSMGTAAGSPYDGQTAIAVNPVGGFNLAVTNPPPSPANERRVVSTGWTPTNAAGDMRPKAVRKISATLTRFRPLDPPCALCVAGELQVGGNAQINAPASGACSPGAWLPGTMTAGPTDQSGHASISGSNAPSVVDNTSSVGSPNYNPAAFSFVYSDSEIAMLRAYAQSRGTYFQGAQSFDASRPLPNGIVFVDTTTGAPFTNGTSTSEQGSASISGNFTWTGWLIVAGTLSVAGSVSLSGVIYSQNDISLSGTAQLTGAVVSENRRDSASTVVDSNITGTSNITYDCGSVRNPGNAIPQGWFVKPGSYMEIAGQ